MQSDCFVHCFALLPFYHSCYCVVIKLSSHKTPRYWLRSRFTLNSAKLDDQEFCDGTCAETSPSFVLDISDLSDSNADDKEDLAMSLEDLKTHFTDLFTNLQYQMDKVHELDQKGIRAISRSVEEHSGMLTASGVEPPVFKGSKTDDLQEFFTRFDSLASLYSWTEERKKQALPLYLKGNALTWYSAVPNMDTTPYGDIVKAMIDHFNSPATHFALRQQLNNRKQGPTESVAEYAAEIRKQCKRLSIPKSEWTNIFISNLREPLRTYCVLQRPDSFQNAENLATLRETVSTEEPSVASITKSAVNKVVDLIQTSLPKTSPSVAAFDQNQSRATFSRSGTSDQPKSEISELTSQIRLLLRELRNNNRPSRPYQNYATSANSNVQSQRGNNSRGFYPQDRTRRTQFGAPVCGVCGRRGHTSYACRDPRIPDRRRPPPPFRPHYQSRPSQSNPSSERNLNH